MLVAHLDTSATTGGPRTCGRHFGCAWTRGTCDTWSIPQRVTSVQRCRAARGIATDTCQGGGYAPLYHQEEPRDGLELDGGRLGRNVPVSPACSHRRQYGGQITPDNSHRHSHTATATATQPHSDNTYRGTIRPKLCMRVPAPRRHSVYRCMKRWMGHDAPRSRSNSMTRGYLRSMVTSRCTHRRRRNSSRAT